MKLAAGEHGIIRNTQHPMYLELMGAPATADGNVDGDDNGDL